MKWIGNKQYTNAYEGMEGVLISSGNHGRVIGKDPTFKSAIFQKAVKDTDRWPHDSRVMNDKLKYFNIQRINDMPSYRPHQAALASQTNHTLISRLRSCIASSILYMSY